jgi:AcrR family transcriptional regulator
VSRSRDSRKAEIVRAAAELWAASGYHGTGVEELSRAVGLQRGALYHHIGSKEALLHEVGRTAIERLLETSAVDVEIAQPEERFRRLSRGLLHDIASNLAEWTVFFREVGWLTGPQRQEIFALRERYEQRWCAALADGAAEGAFRPLDSLDVKAILGMHNYSYLWLRPDGDRSPEDIAERFSDLILDGIRAKEHR